MAIVTNEPQSHPAASPGSVAAPVANSAQPARRTDAVGTEIPVAVHASRNSAVRDITKPMPPVHEETRTVIVFPDGAVVRLAAALNVGELVVLTNQRSGTDVLCRVVNVKAQPGIQNYVELEFTQRAPAFWGPSQSGQKDIPQTHSAPSVSNSSVFASSPATSAPAHRPAAETVPQPVQHTDRSPQLSNVGPMGHRQSSAALPPREPLSPPADAPAPPVSQVAASAPTPAATSAAPAVTRSLGLGAQTFSASASSFGTEQQSSGSKKILIAAAAVVLLGLAGGGAILLRSNRSADVPQPSVQAEEPAIQPEESAIPQPAVPTPAPSAVEARPSNSASAPQAALSTVSLSTTPAAPRPNAVAVQPANNIATAVPQPKRSDARKVLAASMAAPVVSPVARPTSGAAPDLPPVLQADASAANLGSNFIVSGAQSSGPAAPVVRTPDLRQDAKKLSSPSPVYPALARTQRVEGDVVIEALIDPKGQVKPLRVISGPPLLQQAAMNAVRTWKYQPAMLNNQPIATQMQMRVSFRLE